MPAHVPGYCFHKARDLAYVRLGDKVTYLGKYDSPASKAEYRRLVSEWLGTPQQVPTNVPPAMPAAPSPKAVPAPREEEGLTVREFCLSYIKQAQSRYEKHRLSGIRTAFIEMERLFGKIPVSDFGPKRLKEVRGVFVGRGLKRTEVNRRAKYIVNGIKWAVSEELIPGEVLHRLAAVEILRRGEVPIPESEKVKPVDEAIVEETLKHVPEPVAAMARIQLLTGAVSGEVVLMRAADIDMTGDVWKYRPEHHKNQHRGHDRVIVIGPRAQEVLKPFLTGKPQTYLFRLTNGNGAYTSDSYNQAVARGIEVAFPVPPHLGRKIITPTGRKKKPRPETRKEWWARLTQAQRNEVTDWKRKHHWHVHQLRHRAATRLRETFGLDQVQGILGHATIAATQIYAELQREKAVEVARLAG